MPVEYMGWHLITEAVADGMTWEDAKDTPPDDLVLFILLRNASIQRQSDALEKQRGRP